MYLSWKFKQMLIINDYQSTFEIKQFLNLYSTL